LSTCDICGAEFPAHWATPVHCNHKRKNFAGRPEQPPRPPKPNAWLVIHQRYADAIESGHWNQREEMEWYRKTWWKMIPSGCGCKESWIKITDALPIDFTSAETAFQSLWLLHNEVSANHAKKPEMSYELCRALYCQQPSMDD